MATSHAKQRSRPATRPSTDGDVPEVGAREPCPCGSGRRYKACHGRAARAAATSFVARPFEGLPGECDWVAMREFVPAGTASLKLGEPWADRKLTAVTMLPMLAPGSVRDDGELVLGLQTPGGSSDPSRDYAAALERLVELDPGSTLDPATGLPGPGPRLQDVLDRSSAPQVQVHDTFDFWTGTVDDAAGVLPAAIERANAAIVPTARLTGVEAAYWCRMADRDYLRWVLPQREDDVVDALARLHVGGGDSLGADTRLIGAFRAYGLLVAVWDVASAGSAESVEEPAAAFAERYAESLAASAPLTSAERAARAGLLNRQQTLR
jgi:hypothetical protein